MYSTNQSRSVSMKLILLGRLKQLAAMFLRKGDTHVRIGNPGVVPNQLHSAHPGQFIGNPEFSGCYEQLFSTGPRENFSTRRFPGRKDVQYRISAPVSPCEDGCIHIEDLQAWFRKNSASLGSEINTLLACYGVDTSQPIDLFVDHQGRIRVSNDHPDKEKIKEAFAENPEIRNKHVQISSIGSLLKAAEQHQEFAEEYARNPQAAVEKYAHLFSSVKEAFTCRLENGTLSAV
jgi:hypothetical protein